MVTPLQDLGWASLRFVEELGRLGRFTASIGSAMLRPPTRFGRFVDELFKLGVLSLIIVCLCGTAVGAVLGLQGYTNLVRFGAADSLGAVVGLALLCCRSVTDLPARARTTLRLAACTPIFTRFGPRRRGIGWAPGTSDVTTLRSLLRHSHFQRG
jgi:hypothetical protein